MSEKECLCTTPEYTIELNQQGPPGLQGLPGADGFSPSITVAQQDTNNYILTILTKDGQLTTPNLQGRGVPSDGVSGQYLVSQGMGISSWQDIPVASSEQQGIIQIASSDSYEELTNDSAVTPEGVANMLAQDRFGATATTHGTVHPNDPLYVDPNDAGELYIREASAGQQGTVQYGPKQADVSNMTFLGLDDNRPGSGEAKLNGVWLPPATTSTLGGIKVGTNLTITDDGVLSAQVEGGTTNYTDLANKPQINSVELSGNKTADDLGLASADQLDAKQDKFTTINPLAAESITITSPNFMTYSNGQGTIQASPFTTFGYKDNPFPNTNSVPNPGATSTGYRIGGIKYNAFDSSGGRPTYPDVTPGSTIPFVDYQMTLSSTPILLPINYFLGYFDADEEFNFATSCTLASKTGASAMYRIMAPLSEEGIKPSSTFTTGMCISATRTPAQFSGHPYYGVEFTGTSVIITWYDVVFSDEGISGTSLVSYTTTNSQILSLMSKVNCALYFPERAEIDNSGNITKVYPVLNDSYEIIFNGQETTTVSTNRLKLNISATTGNILTVNSDGLYATNPSYTELAGKPSINSTLLEGNLTSEELGLAPSQEVQTLSTEVNTLKANVNNFKFWSGTQTAYDGIATKDPNTLYIITG